ncbi:MAG: AMP-binding protein [Rubrivivax sp.]
MDTATRADRPWLEHYPPGLPAEIEPSGDATLKDLLRQGVERYGALPALHSMGVSLTWRELDRLSADFGAWLQHALALVPGDRVALMLPNLLQYPVAMFGVLRAGLVVVNVNPQYTADELERQLRDSGARAIVVLENFAHTLQEVLERNPAMHPAVVVTAVGDLFPPVREVLTHVVVRHLRRMVPPWQLPQAHTLEHALDVGARHLLDDRRLTGQDLAFLQYTGGTTGTPKGAVLTHGMVMANVLQLSAWISRDLRPGKETALIALPLFHVYALTCALTFLHIGAGLVLVADPRDLKDLTAQMRKAGVTAMIGVNTLYRALLDAPGLDDAAFAHLKLCAAGGMAVQRAVAQRWKARTGRPIVEGWGLTEASPVLTSNRLDIEDWTGTVGFPLPSTEIQVRDAQGQRLPAGAIGELCARGPQVMREYWRQPQETAQAFTADGWLRTGDLGYIDAQGRVTMTDRLKDVIVVSGFKVFPSEVEEVVCAHPGVHEAAAVGIPAASGEAVKIIVVASDPALTEDVLIAHCRRHLTAYKVPSVVVFRSMPLPRSGLGKVLHRALRQA